MLELKDLPQHGTGTSAYAAKLGGKNFNFDNETGYKNDLPPTADGNVAVIKRLLEPISEEAERKFEAFLSPYLVELVQYARVLLIVRTNLSEDVKEAASEFRTANLKSAEESLRSILRKIQYQETLAHLQKELDAAEAREVDKDTEGIADL